jgi:hypothetical protein
MGNGEQQPKRGKPTAAASRLAGGPTACEVGLARIRVVPSLRNDPPTPVRLPQSPGTKRCESSLRTASTQAGDAMAAQSPSHLSPSHLSPSHLSARWDQAFTRPTLAVPFHLPSSRPRHHSEKILLRRRAADTMRAAQLWRVTADVGVLDENGTP